MSTRYNTGNPIESTDVRDMSDNAKNFDEFSISTQQTFTDRLGSERLTIEGAIEKSGFKPGAGDFATGFTVMPGMRNIAWYNPEPSGDNNWYSFLGVIPSPAGYPVAPGTNPAGSLLWSPRTDQALRGELGGDNGGLIVSFKPSGVSSGVKRAIGEALLDGALNVKWRGAAGDWDMGTQTGTDDTAAVQACIDELAIAGSRRVGGAAKLYFPAGHYRLSALTIPESLGFGIDIVSDGMNSGYLWFDHANTAPAITGEVEFIHFRDISLMGSLSDQNNGNSTLWKQVGIKARQPSNYPDIDIRFINCQIAYFQDFAQIYGRGCVFDSCNLVFILNAMHIVADPATHFTPGSYFSSVETGMRHYTFRNCRFDVVSRIYKITGTGAQKDYINNILCVGNDFAQCDVLIDGVDATIRRTNITGNSAVVCWATGVVQVKASASGQMIGNNWAKSFDDSVNPSVTGDYITSLWRCTGSINGLLVSGNTVKCIGGNIVQAGGFSTDVLINGNNFQQAWYAITGNRFVFYSQASCEGLRITNNGFSSTNMAAASYNFYDASVQNSPKTVVSGNSAPWSWADYRIRYTPVLRFNGVATATAMTAQGRYVVEDGKVIVEVALAGSPVETSGNIGISLPPITAVPEYAAITTSYAGGGHVMRYTNLTGTNLSMLPIEVNPQTQEAELWVASTSLTPARLTGANKANPVALFCKFEYRH